MQKHHEVSRLEGFSDAVFAFAVTLLVVSLEVPKSFDELMQSMRELVPFALMFAMVCWIWYEHHVFFRRCGVQDGWTAFLNCVLLFLVLFYVYPLKFLTRQLVGPIFGLNTDTGMRSFHDGAKLMLLYSGGIVAIFGTLALLYRHAWRLRVQLGLTPADEVTVRFAMRGHLLTALIGCVSIAITLLRAEWTPIAGFIYFLIGPAQAWNGFQSGRAQRQLQATGPAPS